MRMGSQYRVMKAVVVALGQTKVSTSEFGAGFKGHSYHKGKAKSPQVPIDIDERRTNRGLFCGRGG